MEGVLSMGERLFGGGAVQREVLSGGRCCLGGRYCPGERFSL